MSDLDQVSLTIGELRQATSNMARALADTNAKLEVMGGKLDDLILRDREFRTSMKIGTKIAYGVAASLGGAAAAILHWLFPNLFK